ncbi:MAG TPA: AAA family ATPase, partial [Rhizobiales bacterium]|nr:AAA family ATPase [Hyphomicrobiales bacterium]
MDTGLTTLSEKDILKHLTTAQSLVERATVIIRGDGSHKARTELAGTHRRFVSTVSTGPSTNTVNVKIAETIQNIAPEDGMLSIAQHTLKFR